MLNSMNEIQIEESLVLQKHPVEAKRMRKWLEDRVEAGKKKKISEVITLTPVLAQLLMERNPVNRPLSRRNSDELQRDIASNRFMFNGESVSVCLSGALGNGQHRCDAVIKTAIPVETVIVFGVPDDARYTIDTGKPKTVSQFLHMKGRVYTHALGAAVNYVLQWQDNKRVSYSQNKPTRQAILAAADTLKGIDESVSFTQHSMKTIRSHAVLAMCHWVFWKRSTRELADQFILRLIDGENLTKGNPILVCRNRILNMNRGDPSGARIELIFKCWNAWRRGVTGDRFRVTGDTLPKLER